MKIIYTVVILIHFFNQFILKRIPAMGQKVQIGHFFNGHKNEILFAYPRMFDDTDSNKTTIHSKHEVSVKTIVGAQTFLISYSVRLFE